MNFLTLYIFIDFILIFQIFERPKKAKIWVYIARDLRGADLATRTRGSATWANTDPRGHLRGAQAKGKWAKRIGPTGIVGPIIGVEIRGGIIRPIGRHKGLSLLPLYRW